MKNKITLDAIRDINEFVAIVSQIPHEVFLVSGKGYRVNAKSILGVLASITFNELWVECEVNIFNYIQKFIKVESDGIIKSTPMEKLRQNGFTF